MEIKLFETLSKSSLKLEGAVSEISDIDNKEVLNGQPYEFKVMNEKLQQYNSGWTKYLLFKFPKLANVTNNKNIKITSILHLLHSIATDIVIARIVKYNPETKKINIRYLISQPNKLQQCSNLKELYQVMVKTYEYEGRVLLASDFK